MRVDGKHPHTSAKVHLNSQIFPQPYNGKTFRFLSKLTDVTTILLRKVYKISFVIDERILTAYKGS